MRIHLFLLATLMGVGASCVDQSPDMGAIDVRVLLTGPDGSFNKFAVRVDGGPPQAFGAASSLIVPVAAGSRVLVLEGTADNCAVDVGPNRTVQVPVNDTIVLTYGVGCAERRGDILANVTSEGVDFPARYTINLDAGVGLRTDSVPTAGSLRFAGVREGLHFMSLTTPSNCQASSTDAATISVQHGKTSEVHFRVVCTLLPGVMRVAVTTTGVDPDTMYHVSVAESGTGSMKEADVSGNGSVTFTKLSAISHEVTLSGAARNCTIGAQARRTVSVPSKDTVVVQYQVSCTSASKIRITTATSGGDADADGYAITIRGPMEEGASLMPAGVTVLTPLEAGDYSLELTGVAVNCDLTATVPKTVTVAAGLTTDIAISTSCGAATTIAYMEDRDLYLFRTNDTKPQLLAKLRGQPSWSPDATRIAARSYGGGNEDIWAITLATQTQVQLTSAAGRDNSPAWSPDGNTIAFVSEREGRASIWIMNADGTGQRVLYVHAKDGARDPAWSPDGKKLAFSIDGDTGGLWVMNADGTGVTRLTTGHDVTPEWSPDGTQIAFSHAEDCYTDNLYYCGRIATIKPDGSGLTVIGRAEGYDTGPSWSADGKWVAFTRWGCNGNCVDGFHAARVDGTRVQLLRAAGMIDHAAWRR
jgi:hypothetical protein